MEAVAGWAAMPGGTATTLTAHPREPRNSSLSGPTGRRGRPPTCGSWLLAGDVLLHLLEGRLDTLEAGADALAGLRHGDVAGKGLEALLESLLGLLEVLQLVGAIVTRRLGDVFADILELV